MKKTKMNGLYKTAFILLIVCVPLFVMSVIVAYLFERIYLSAIFSAGGAFLAFFGIIFATLSKPKKENQNPDVTTEDKNLNSENNS